MGVRRLVPFSDTVPEISTVYWSQSRETRKLLTASALPAPAKQTDYTLSLHHLWNICALLGLSGAVKIIQMCTTFLVPSICLLGIILGCPAICYLLKIFLSVFTEIVGHKRCFERPQISTNSLNIVFQSMGKKHLRVSKWLNFPYALTEAIETIFTLIASLIYFKYIYFILCIFQI